jgi:hypothetical protein
MEKPLPILIENALQIAWDYLERSGELGDPEEASHFLLQSMGRMVREGERRRLMLTNKAIDEYKRIRAGQLAA